ncbi:hypothetical protein HOP50_11g63980 [Chloropicon primus]|nr:hypothetical protein HOP50_11g63980 [Chloropicon primus]
MATLQGEELAEELAEGSGVVAVEGEEDALQGTPSATLEVIKKCMLREASFRRPAKGKGGGGGGRGGPRKKGGGGKKKAKAATAVDGEGDSMKVETFRWEGHENVLFIVFPNKIALRNGLTRLSVFLEDPVEAGTIMAANDVRPGKYVAASYTGHNFRPSDYAKFAAKAREESKALEPEEEELWGILLKEFPGFEGGGGECWGCIATARGLNKGEVANTLLHESMHGLFYAHSELRAVTWKFWDEVMDASEKSLWLHFLSSIGYNSSNEEVCVNEMLAYLTTEKELLRKYSIKPLEQVDGRGGVLTMERLQEQFVKYVEGHIPFPKPHLRGQYCAFKA